MFFAIKVKISQERLHLTTVPICHDTNNESVWETKIDDNIRTEGFCDQQKEVLHLFVCQSRHPSMSFNINVQDLSKKSMIPLHGSSSQPNLHLAVTMNALQINRTGTITVLPTASVKIRSQNDPFHHLRALYGTCDQTKVKSPQRPYAGLTSNQLKHQIA